MVGSKLMEAVGVYSLALRTVFKFGSKVENGKLKLWPASHRRFVTSNAMNCRYLSMRLSDYRQTTYYLYLLCGFQGIFFRMKILFILFYLQTF